MADKSPFEVSEEDYKSAVFEEGGSLVVDLSGIEELKFEALPKGVYDVVIDEVQWGKSKRSGNDMFTFILEVQGGDYDKRKLYWYGSMSPKAIRGTKAGLMRIDPVLFGGKFSPQQIVDEGTLLGKALKVKVNIQTNEETGNDSNNVQFLPNVEGAAPAAGGNAFFDGN